MGDMRSTCYWCKQTYYAEGGHMCEKKRAYEEEEKKERVIMDKSKEVRTRDEFLMKKRVNLRTDNIRLIPIDIWDEDEWRDCTLRDIAIILNQCCGQGVTWQLGHELSKRLNISHDDVDIALDNIIREYSKQAEEEGISAFKSQDKTPPREKRAMEEYDKNYPLTNN